MSFFKSCRDCGRLFSSSPLSRCAACYRQYRASLSGSAINQGRGWAWSRIRAQVLAAEPLCRSCQKQPATIVDHIVERRYGGGDDVINLQPLCKSCHQLKGRKEP